MEKKTIKYDNRFNSYNKKSGERKVRNMKYEILKIKCNQIL